VEEGPVAIVGAPVRARPRRKTREKARGPRIRRFLVARLARGPEQLRGPEQRAVVVHDVLAPVVRELHVVGGQEGPAVFGGAEVVGLPLARRRPEGGLGQGGDGEAAPGAEAALVFGLVGARDGLRARVAADAAVVGALGRSRPRHRAIERPPGRLHADEVVRAPRRLVEQTPQVLAEEGIGAALQEVVGLQESPGGQGNLLRVEVRGIRQVREMFAVVAGGVVPAAVRVHHAVAPAFQGHRAVRLVEEARRALALEVVQDVGEGVALEHALSMRKGEEDTVPPPVTQATRNAPSRWSEEKSTVQYVQSRQRATAPAGRGGAAATRAPLAASWTSQERTVSPLPPWTTARFGPMTS
jgi:hypothetical protein